MFNKILKEQILLELSMRDHYENYIKPKFDIGFDDYSTYAKLDPTTSENQRGKYVEWILKNFVKPDGTWNTDITNMNNVKTALARFVKKPVDINSIKSFSQLEEYVETIPEISGKEKKRKEKNLYDFPDDIKVLDDTDEWLVIETLTREGNIKGAQWRTNPQSDWCTAYLDTESHWNNYSRRGDLIQFINKADPYEKYQIMVVDGKITESRDYKDRIDNKPFQLIEDELPDFEDNYGKIEPRPPFKFIWDEEGAAYNLLSENGVDDDQQYLNRDPDEDEYEFYYEEAISNEEYQINHWDRFIKAGFEIYKYESDNKYFDKYKMRYFSGYFLNPITGDTSDKEPAKDAVLEMYNEVEEEWNDFIDDEVEPTQNAGESTEDYTVRLDDWKQDKFKEFRSDNKLADFMEYFQDDFPYEYAFQSGLYSYKHDNSDEQLKFNFESIRKMLSMMPMITK